MSAIEDVTSPLPGTFYHRESPSSPPYVTIGSKVAAGDTVGIVEVMKMFNPITTDVAGTVIEICVGDEEPVDVDEVLIKVEAE